MEKDIKGKNYRKLVKGLDEIDTKKTKKVKKERIWEIDFLRCIPIILVMLYHLCYYFAYIPQMLFTNYKSQILNYPSYMSFISFCKDDIFNGKIFIEVLQPFFSGVFLLVCGISTSLTRSNIRRSIYLWIISLLLSFATYIFSIITGNNFLIVFGVIHLMAFTITIYTLLEILFKYAFKRQVDPIICLIIGLVILFVGYLINWPIQSFNKFSDVLNHIPGIAIGKYVGGQDYFPIFPKAGVIFIGISLGKLLYGDIKKSVLPSLDVKFFKPFCFIGSHTIWFYFLHPPVFIAIIVLVMMAMGFEMDFSSLL